MSNILVTTQQNVIDVTNNSGITVTTPEGQTINVEVPNSSVNVATTTDEITVVTNGQLTYNITAQDTDQVPEGTTNLYYTNARADARVQLGIDNIDFPVDSVNGQTNTVVLDTDDISEGSNQYFTTSRARQSISAGTGISYDSSTGVITSTATGNITSVNGQTGPTVVLTTTDVNEGTNLYYTDSRARSSISAGTGVTYNSSTGAISIGQAVATTDHPQFAGLSSTRTITGGGKLVDSNGDVLVPKSANHSSQLAVAGFFDNTTANRRGIIVSREYGQNAGSNTNSNTVGNATMVMEASRGTALTPTAIASSNNTLGGMAIGYYDGSRWTSESGLSSPIAWVGQNTETTASETSVFTGSISGTTLTVTAVSSGEIHAGQLITGTGIASGTTISAYGSNTFGGVGTYTVSLSQTVSSTTITGVGTKSGGGRLVGVLAPTNNKASAASRQTFYVTANSKPIAPTINGVNVPQNSSLNIIQGNIDSGDTTFVSSDGQIVYKGRGNQTMSLNQMTLFMTGVPYNDEARFTGYIDNGSGSAGNTLTVTAVESGVIYVGQKIVAAALSTKTPYFISALGTGTGGVGTYTVSSSFQTAGTTLGSSSSPVNIIGTPDDYGMRGSGNSINVFSARKSQVQGRRAPLKNNDDIFNFYASAQTGAVGTGNQTGVGSMGFYAAEDFTTSSAGSGFTLLTTNIGSTNQTYRMIATSNNILLNSDSFTIEDKDGNDNLTIDTNGNIVVSRGSLTTNSITSSGNITATKFYGDGSSLTGITISTGNIDVGQYNPNTITTTTGNLILSSSADFVNVNSNNFNVNRKDTGESMLFLDKNNGKTGLSIVNQRATAASDFALVNFSTFRGNGSSFTPTQQGDNIGEFKFNGNAYTGSNPGVPMGPCANIGAYATENWTSTANGAGFYFRAVKPGTLDSVDVINGNASILNFNSSQVFINDENYNPRVIVDSTKAKFNLPVEFPVDTAANWNTVTGSIGQQVCVSDSASGSNPNGMMAFWDTTHSRWSYVHDNSAV